MSDGKNILNELKKLPKPELQKHVQDQMFLEIQTFSKKHQIKQRWEIKMKKTFVSVVTAVALVTLSFISYNALMEEDVSSNKPGQQIDEVEQRDSTDAEPGKVIEKPLDPIDLKLDENMVAMEDLYFGISMKKGTVFIDRRVEDGFTMVDIRDKKSNELLYRYGESVGKSKEKHVFREVQTKYSKVRIHAFLEIDPNTHLINSVNDMRIEVFSEEVPFEERGIFDQSRSGKYPTEKIEIVALGDFAVEIVNGVYYEIEYERFYEGFVVGVVNLD